MVDQSTHEASSAVACPIVNAHRLSVLPCAQCTANNFQPGSPLCGFCYATGSCVEITARNALVGPCAGPDAPAASPDAQYRNALYDGPVAPGQDYSLGLDGACDCRPGVWNDCRSCSAHPRCSWVAGGTERRTWEFHLFGSTSVTHVQEVSLDGTCRRVLESERTYELTDSAGHALVSLEVEPHAREVYWAQCSVSGGPSRILLVGGGVFLVLGFGVCDLLRRLQRVCCGRDLRRRNPASENTPLVGEHGNTIQPVV